MIEYPKARTEQSIGQFDTVYTDITCARTVQPCEIS